MTLHIVDHLILGEYLSCFGISADPIPRWPKYGQEAQHRLSGGVK